MRTATGWREVADLTKSKPASKLQDARRRDGSIGRDPNEIMRSMQVIVSADDVPGARRLVIELIEAGSRHLVIGPRPPIPSAAWLAEEIIEPSWPKALAWPKAGQPGR